MSTNPVPGRRPTTPSSSNFQSRDSLDCESMNEALSSPPANVVPQSPLSHNVVPQPRPATSISHDVNTTAASCMTSAAATNSAIASPTRYTNAVVEFQRAEAADAAAAVFPDLLVDGAIDSSTTTTAAAAAKQAPSITALPSTLVADPPAQESRVLVIYTGGTIGMKRLPPDAGYVPVHNWLGRSLADMARFNDREANGASMLSGGAVPEETIRCYTMPAEGARNGGTTPEPDARQSVTTVRRPALLTPRSLYDRRVRYTILEYDPLLDSANMTMTDWTKIAKDIEVNYAHYDAFVVLHGTDTMAYTASALSFMLEDLGKTVIITGSQVPLAEWRTDAEDNLLGSLLIAGHFVIPEVCVYFGHKLFRGNRCTKVDAMDFSAFDSPNMKPLATIGVKIDVNWSAVRRANSISRFHVHKQLDPNVATLRLFPGITASTVRAFLAPPMQGVVLETYGAGNVPSSRKDILGLIGEACARGVVVVNCTQCKRGLVSDLYETGKVLLELGVIAGFDMTAECALTKLSYLLSKYPSNPTEVRRLVGKNLRGELTSAHSMYQHLHPHGSPHVNFHTSAFISALAQALNIQSQSERHRLENALMPHLVCAAAGSSLNADALDKLKEASSSPNTILNAVDFDGRTPLHIACCVGNYGVVEHLLLMGASLHVRDRCKWTPLVWACRNRHVDIAALLVRAGALFDSSDEAAYMDFFKAVQGGDLIAVRMYVDCGIDVNAIMFNRQTALHLACMGAQMEVVHYLLSVDGINPELPDALGRRAKDYLVD